MGLNRVNIAQHIETTLTRHPKVENHDIRLVFEKGFDRFLVIARFSYNLDVRLLDENALDSRSEKQVIVHDEGCDLHYCYFL